MVPCLPIFSSFSYLICDANHLINHFCLLHTKLCWMLNLRQNKHASSWYNMLVPRLKKIAYQFWKKFLQDFYINGRLLCAGEMVGQLRVHTALTEDLRFIPNTYSCELIFSQLPVLAAPGDLTPCCLPPVPAFTHGCS